MLLKHILTLLIEPFILVFILLDGGIALLDRSVHHVRHLVSLVEGLVHHACDLVVPCKEF